MHIDAIIKNMALRFLYFLTILLFTHHQIFGSDSFEKFSENGKYGLKNKTTGNTIFEARYDDIGWSEGEFKIINNRIGLKQNEKWALASIDGSKVTRHYFSVLYPFREEAFIIGQRSNFSILNDYGVINSKGVNIVPVEYQWISPIENRLIVSKRKGSESTFGLLNKNGNTILPLEFKNITRVDAKTLAVKNNLGLYALYSTEGKALSEFLYETILRHSENTFRIKYFNKEGLIDRKGNVIIPAEYRSIDYKNEMARVLPYNKWTIFSSHEGPKNLNHDDISLLTSQKVVAKTLDNSAIINIANQEYEHYEVGGQQASASNELVILSKGGSFGVIDSLGKTILPFQFDSIRIFKNVAYGKSQRRDDQSWAPYSLKGKRIGIQFYESYKEEANGNFLAVKNNKHGVLDAEGYELTPFIFDRIGVFINGLAVANYQERQGVIRTNGNWLITPYKDTIQIIDNLIYYQQGTEYGIYDVFERQVFRTNAPLKPFLNAFVEKSEDGYSIYSANADLLSEQKYDSVYQISPNHLVLKSSNKFQLLKINEESFFNLDTRIQKVRSYNEGFTSIFMEDHWGFLSDQGLLTIANRYLDAKNFSEGLSAVNINGKWGYIDVNDQIAIQPTLEMAESFENGIAIIKADGKYGLINKNGDYILDGVYDMITQNEGYLLLEKDGLNGFATSNGQLIRFPQFESISTTDGIHFVVGKNKKLGVVDVNGLDLVAVSFDLIKQSGNVFLAMEKQNWTDLPLGAGK